MYHVVFVETLKHHSHMAKGGHGLPKVSSGSTMPYCSTPCRQGTPEMALWSFQQWPAHRAIDLRLSSTHLDTLHRTPYTYVKDRDVMCSRNNLDNYFVLDALFSPKNLLFFDFFCLEKLLLLLEVVGVNRSHKGCFPTVHASQLSCYSKIPQ
jgi:hypothetical protein